VPNALLAAGHSLTVTSPSNRDVQKCNWPQSTSIQGPSSVYAGFPT
jgi:hypothetical protein